MADCVGLPCPYSFKITLLACGMQQIILFFFKRKMTKVLFGLMEHNGMKWIRVEWNRAE
jgi:hypothetical protein